MDVTAAVWGETLAASMPVALPCRRACDCLHMGYHLTVS